MFITGKHSPPPQVHGPPASVRVRHQPRCQDALQADREGDERAGQDHQRPAYSRRLALHHRVRDEAPARPGGARVQGLQEVSNFPLYPFEIYLPFFKFQTC